MNNIINLTPHPITIVMGEEKVVIPSSGVIARCKEEVEIIGDINGIPVIRKKFGQVENLPEPIPGTVFIVSALVAQAARRSDVLCPGDPVRDAEGRITGCKALCSVV